MCNVCPMSFPMVSSESAGRAWVTTPVDSGQQRLLFTVSLLLDRQVLGGMRVSRGFRFSVSACGRSLWRGGGACAQLYACRALSCLVSR